MKPTVIANANATAQAGSGAGPGTGASTGHAAGVHIPINREYGTAPPQQQGQQYPHQQSPYVDGNTGYGSPRQQQMPQPQSHHQPQFFQSAFGLEPDMDMDNMFPRTRLGRLHHDPFAGFGGSHFGFPQFSTLGRRGRAAGGANNQMDNDDDFFNRLPSDFRQYIPDGFGARRGGGGATHSQHGGIPQQHQQQPVPQQQQETPYYLPDYLPQHQQQPQQMPQSPSKRLCDAAIQTEDPAGRSEVDCAPSGTRNDNNLNQHGLRNTMDMGVKSAAEQELAARAHSAPPNEQQQQQRPPPNASQQQFGTQTSPQVQQGNYSPAAGQYQQHSIPSIPPLHKAYYAPQQQAHPQQKQQTPPPPQTPNGTYVRTIPIFVEGRTEPIINAHKEIPNQYAAPGAPSSTQASAQARAYAPQQQQQHQQQHQQRPTPLNTQHTQQQPPPPEQAEADGGAGLPPQTPHTLDSINKIQDIQRDVLDLMGKVEKFQGTRQDKEYVYLDEMLTRNLLKLDTIDTNGKDSIRLARKEAIKCIQASINVLEAKAEENARRTAGADVSVPERAAASVAADASASQATDPQTPQPADATQIQQPIPLPAPEPKTDAAASVTAAERTNNESTTTAASVEAASAESTAQTTTLEESSK
ncbi:BAG domain-containing protein Samui isoform X2 [Scaptodrosophila lebanonensis]|uniref:BAG domain-containing protein Samui isoform X2 n=2 Tax=Drosophila lebanonensis TaxID=7225 RepID=A0A6J2TBS2_DROLE|nr:BAG domain-containing protein Samui isoform X2 [Scaptodrosophila lebanonensis]